LSDTKKKKWRQKKKFSYARGKEKKKARITQGLEGEKGQGSKQKVAGPVNDRALTS